MQLQRVVMLICGASAFSQAWASGNATLVPMDEPATTLVSPSANIQAIQYSFGGPPAISLITGTPLLCANTSAPTANPATLLSTAYYSAFGSAAASPAPFVFGASAATPAQSATAAGATSINYNGSTVAFAGDPLDALVCYGTDANGVHAVTRNLFDGDFEPVVYNSSVALSVFHVPVNSSDYYAYTVDVTIPPLPSGTTCGPTGLDCNFTLVEGYDSSVFATGAGGWCLANSATAQSCPASTTLGNVNVNYTNYGTTVSLLAPVAPNPAKTYRFIAFRYLKTGVNAVPSTGAPVAMAALFSPTDLGENKLDDNVAIGNNTLANVAPTVVQDNAYTAFGLNLMALQENTDSAALTFDISDSDTPESSGSLLNAAVTLNLPNGLQVPVAANCGATTPITTLPVSRTCTIAIPLSNPTFWDAAVTAPYQGQFNNVATDVTNGTYASGLSAGVQIVVTDSAGKSGTSVSMPVHIYSTKNDAPVASAVAAVLPGAVDSFQNNATIPTYSCSAAATSGATVCGTRSYVDLTGAFTAAPGPLAAFDELASQTTAVVPYVDGANGGNVHCVSEFTGATAPASIFASNGNPLVQPGATAGSYDVNFFLTNPVTVGSQLCTVTFTDAMQGASPPPFPNGETAATAPAQFRVLVNP